VARSPDVAFRCARRDRESSDVGDGQVSDGHFRSGPMDPYGRTRQTERQYVKRDEQPGPSPACRVLVVDHDADNRRAAESALRAQGFEVRCATGAIEAMLAVEAAKPDIVFCELGLPGVDGLVLAEALKRGDAREATTVVGFTADVRLKERASLHGRFDALVETPVDWRTLSELLHTLRTRLSPASAGVQPKVSAATVLVVDDDSDSREALTEILEEGGLKVLTADDGHEALNVLRSGQVAVDALLLDLMMPGMDGWTVLAQMKSDEALRRIPVVVMSAGGARALATLPATQPGLTKPLKIERLFDALGAVLPQLHR